MKQARSFLVGAVVAGSLVALGPRLIEHLGPSVAEAAAPSTKVQAAQQAFKLHEAAFQSGMATAEDVYVWSRRWMEADGSSASAKKAHLTRMNALNAAVQKNVAAGTTNQADAAACTFYVAEAKELSP